MFASVGMSVFFFLFEASSDGCLRGVGPGQKAHSTVDIYQASRQPVPLLYARAFSLCVTYEFIMFRFYFRIHPSDEAKKKKKMATKTITTTKRYYNINI